MTLLRRWLWVIHVSLHDEGCRAFFCVRAMDASCLSVGYRMRVSDWKRMLWLRQKYNAAAMHRLHAVPLFS
jgi:hypothetical protein